MDEIFKCPECEADIDIRADEAGRRCASCNAYHRRPGKDYLPGTLANNDKKEDKKLKELIQYAKRSGASEAAIISTKDIVVEDGLADKCREPKCENYGLSKSCPPNVSGPEEIRKKIESTEKAVFFKIDVPSETLYSGEGREVFQLLHEISSGIEKNAVEMGFKDAQAYAGGSCKKIFCYEHSECLALSEKAECRHPQYARQSMSGFGINVLELFRTAGWKMNRATRDAGQEVAGISNICGLVLIF